LDVVLVIVGAGILAAHYIDLVVAATGTADAFQLSYALELVDVSGVALGRRTCGIALTRRCEVWRSLRSVRLCTLDSLTLEPERRASAPLAANSAGYRKLSRCILLWECVEGWRVRNERWPSLEALQLREWVATHVKGHGVEMWTTSRQRFQTFRRAVKASVASFARNAARSKPHSA
jgi:hypothetical protein